MVSYLVDVTATLHLQNTECKPWSFSPRVLLSLLDDLKHDLEHARARVCVGVYTRVRVCVCVCVCV